MFANVNYTSFFLQKMSQPLKDFNYQQRKTEKLVKPVVVTEGSYSTESKLSTSNFPHDPKAVLKEKDDPTTARDMKEPQDHGAKVHKITLQEYRERAKSKSPVKPVESASAKQKTDDRCSENIVSVKTDEERDRPPVDLKPDRKNERAMSTDEVADVSFDLADMSIDNTEDDRMKTSTCGGVPKVDSSVALQKPLNENKLKLKKAVSSTQCSSQLPDSGLKSTSKSYGSLPISKPKPDSVVNHGDSGLNKASSTMNKPESGGENNKLEDILSKNSNYMALPLSERLKVKKDGSESHMATFQQTNSVKQKLVTNSSLQTGSQSEVIDLTEDEEHPEPVKQGTATSNPSKLFGKDQNVKMPTFQSLSTQASSNKQLDSTQKVSASQSQLWTEMRAQSGLSSSSGSQARDFKPAKQELTQSIQEDTRRRNDLTKLLDKQKVRLLYLM